MSAAMPTEGLLKPAHLNRRHIDGPLLSWGGQMHWLTPRERIALFFRFVTVEQIATRRFKNYSAWRRAALRKEETP